MAKFVGSRPRRQKGEGFPGQHIVVLPRSVIAEARKHPLINGLVPTDVGYFPRAAEHLRERPEGVDQVIFFLHPRLRLV